MQVARSAIAALIVAPLAFALGTHQDAGHAEAPTAVHAPAWEYRVVGITELHGRSLEYLKKALDESEGGKSLMEGLLGVAKGADEQLAKKSEDLLNALGAEGWELVHADARHMILKRPKV